MLSRMNSLATLLNTKLEGTIAETLFSRFGKRFYFPRGIAAQAAEAREHAHRYDATVGLARKGGGPMMPAAMEALVSPLSRAEAVDYAPNGGDSALRDAWLREIISKNPGLSKEKMSMPMVVAGLTNGIAQIADLFTDPGDLVVVPDLYWGNYRLIFEERHEAVITTYPFYSDSGGFNVAGLAACLKGVDKAIVLLNFPNNPTGYAPMIAEAEAIRDVLSDAARAGTKVLGVCDDAYFGLFYEEGIYPHSPFALLANAHPGILAVKVDGPTKEDFAWGFRIGFVTFGSPNLEAEHYRAIEQKLLGAIRSSVSNCSRPAQSLLIRAMSHPDYHAQKNALKDELESRYRVAKSIVGKIPAGSVLTPLPFNSGYFLTFAIPGRAEELRRALLHNHGIGTIAIGEDYLRVAYAGIEGDAVEPLFKEIIAIAGKLVDVPRASGEKPSS